MFTSERALKAFFSAFILIILLALALGSFLAIQSIGRIDEVEKSSEELDVRNLGFNPRFRAQIYRLQSVALRARITGDESYSKRFDLLEKDLSTFLSSRKETFDLEEEEILFSNLNEKLRFFLVELRLGLENNNGENESESLSEIQERISGLSESLQRLGDGLPSLELQWMLQRCHASLLLVKIRGTAKQAAIFEELLTELRETLTQAQTEIAEEGRKLTALNNFSTRLLNFETEMKVITASWVKKGSSEKRFHDLEKIQEMRDEIIEIAQLLGDSRRKSFKDSIKDYKSLAEGMPYSIAIALGLLFVSLFVIGWLAKIAFLKPIEMSLAEAEETISSQGNLASIGTLAAGVAHEIRNPLTAIKARLFALGEISRNDESMTRQVSAIQDETNRMERIVQDFLSFARPSHPNPEVIKVADLLDDIHALALPEMNVRGITLVVDRSVEVHLSFDKEQIKQVFLNLIRNAAEACLEGGKIILSSERQGKNVLLTVSDSGAGIPRQYLGDIFDPFFSKKKAGTGLGLAICRKIVETHDGQITCESIEGKGTTFTITLDAI